MTCKTTRNSNNEDVPVKNPGRKKKYPSIDERLEMAEEKIAQLTTLNQDRKILIEKTENMLNSRKAALVKSQAALDKEILKKEKLLDIKNRPVTASERRAEKIAQKNKLDEIIDALKESGKSIDDLLEFIKK